MHRSRASGPAGKQCQRARLNAEGDQSVPYLQLDVPNHYPVEVKRGLARRLGEKYARIMQTTPEQVTVAFRELGEGGVWRCSATRRLRPTRETPQSTAAAAHESFAENF